MKRTSSLQKDEEGSLVGCLGEMLTKAVIVFKI